MDATPFTAILEALLARSPGAYGAALVDGEGETVDYAGLVVPYDMRVAGAELQIITRRLEEIAPLGSPKFMMIRGAKKTVVARVLPDGYVLTVLFRKRAGFGVSQRAIMQCERELAREAGWPPPGGRAWFAVNVQVDARGKPRRLAPGIPVEVLGTVVGLHAREQGFRVRTPEGHELTLVRESRKRWYADEEIATKPL